MTTSAFAVSNAIFSNAERVAEHEDVLMFPPLVELRKEVKQWWGLIQGAEDPGIADLRSLLWRLLLSLQLTLRPFDHPALVLADQLEGIRHLAGQVPEVRDRVPKLNSLVLHLYRNPHNPKRDRLLGLLQELFAEGIIRVGIVTALTRWPLPGSGADLEGREQFVVPIPSRSVLMSRIFDYIIVPGSSRYCPFQAEIFNASRTADLRVIRFDSETAHRPRRPALPRGPSMNVQPPTKPRRDLQNQDGPDTSILDTQIDAGFWTALRRASRGLEEHVEPESPDRQHLVRARLVLFANGHWMNLREDQKVIEISQWVDGLEEPQSLRRFPRRQVSELQEGHLIVLRTMGSGDYLLDVADGLLKAHGLADLRRSSTDWKAALEMALRQHGTGGMARRLRSLGHPVNSSSYLWTWTTNHVMRPESQSLFVDLVRVLSSLGYSLDNLDPEEAAIERWVGMGQVIRYHYKAGAVIRRSLLKRLRSLIAAGCHIDTEYQLALEGVAAGEMSVLRIAAVDTESALVPYATTGTLRQL